MKCTLLFVSEIPDIVLPKSGDHPMKTMEEMQTFIKGLQTVYSSVRLLDSNEVNQIPANPPVLPTSSEKQKRYYASICAAKLVLQTKTKQCRIELYGDEIANITSTYCEIEGKPYVLEIVQCSPCQTTLDADTGDRIMQELSGYNRKLYRDALTGAYNRRYYEEVTSKLAGPAGVALIDIDDFKVCNDTYGHHVGDLALEAAAKAIRSYIRDTDTLIRFGGDEFLLILPGIPSDYLDVVLERVRAEVHNATIPGHPHIHLSVSIGGVEQTITDTMEATVRQADGLMYQAKDRKNHVVTASINSVLPAHSTTEPQKAQILVVDDSEMNRMLLSEILGEDYDILEAKDGKECLAKLHAYSGRIALVLLDIHMPVMDGYEVLRIMNTTHIIEDIPVIMISSEDSEAAIRQSYELGATDYINRPFDAKVVYRRVFNTIKLYSKQRRLVRLVSDQIRKQEKSTTMLVSVLSQIVEFRNGESGDHVKHIRVISELIMSRLLETSTDYKISPEEQDDIPLASALHDIGKIAIDEKILNKPGKLTANEFEVMKTHTTEGAEMLSKSENFDQEPLLHTAYEIARWHHERWDGDGYPDGLKGNEIPISAQIVSIADVYDALTSERCYKPPFEHEAAIRMILNGECGVFNPQLLDCLKDVQGNLKAELKKNYQ